MGHKCIYLDEFYKYVFHVFVVLGSQTFSLKIYCGFNINAYCSTVFICVGISEMHPNSCKNMGICDVFRAVDTRENISKFYLNTLRLRQSGRHFADDIFKCIFLNEKVLIFIQISLKLVPKNPINNKSTLFQIMAWCWSGDKPLSEPMLVYLTDTYICHSASMSL